MAYNTFTDRTPGRMPQTGRKENTGHSSISRPLLLTDWEEVRDRVYPYLLPQKENGGFLDSLVHRPFLDLAVCHYIRMELGNSHTASIPVKKGFLQAWGIQEKCLEKQSMKNMDRDGYRISSMQEVLEALTGDVFPVGPDLPYVMTNSSGVYGAAGILDKSMIARFAEKFGTDLYILPSSIHELLILPDFGRAETEELGQIVKVVNRAEVAPEDRLSDHVYRYNRQADEIRIAG